MSREPRTRKSAIPRVGIGYDIHRLVDGRSLMLAGIQVPFERGLHGHSDADVVLHAVTDALCGAAGLPDIGDLFPDSDPKYKGIDSRKLLAEVVQRLRATGFVVGNLDVIVHAERPKLSPHKRAMAESLAKMLDLPPEAVSVKAKTNEGLGSVGRGDAIACTAVVLIANAELPIAD
ncbi:MAG TPA: 2-C-methyl-D-erythritol 2,4-cyclodiphosphate synthase [Phycisphaerae bacterium]|jgi:2-C-methyl-D-erythritol 2,4-cyclodiphosphate synthase